MPRLADRKRLPPGGLRYYCPHTNWTPTPHLSFDATVQQIVEYRIKNRHLSEKHGWSTDPRDVAIELDAVNAKICSEMGWNAYITDGNPDDSSFPFLGRLGQFARNAATGVATIREWEIAGGRVVPKEQAEARAKVCIKCPKNVKGDLLDFFTQEAARLMKLQLETKNNMKLFTSVDDDLGLCDACGCVQKLKVWAPKDVIDLMKPEIRALLHPDCWVLHEK